MTKLNKIGFALWVMMLLCVAVGSLLPLNKVPSDAFMLGDKFLHLGAYLVIGVFALLAASNSTLAFWLLGISFTASLMIEILQPLSGRSFELLDIAANGIGVIIAIPIWWYVIFPLLSRYQLNKGN
ncbi:MAG: VanZ family protein [Sneathiella sp.]|nr:VanZ family protein [Sneathiella sp.]